jgi:PAS domain S-box-containing protein
MANLVDKNFVWQARLTHKKQIAKHIWEFTVQIESDGFSFVAGQYVWINLKELSVPDEHGSRRAFSISSAPDAHTLQFFFRESDSGYKQSLLALKENDVVEVVGPFGSSFTMPEYEESELILISGGVGLSPFLSLIRTHLADSSFQKKIVLVTLNTSQEDVVYLKELQEYARTHKTFHYVNVVGRKFSWADIAPHVSYGGYAWFISGSQPMVDWVHGVLKQNEIPRNKMFFENHYPTNTSPINKMFEENKIRFLSGDLSFRGFRNRLLEKYLPIILLLAALFAVVSSLFYESAGQSSIIPKTTAGILISLLGAWFIFKHQREIIRFLLLSFASIVLFYALSLPQYALHVVYWIITFPIICFLLSENRGWYVCVIFNFFVDLYIILIILGFIASPLSSIALLQIGLSLLFTTLLAGFYERMVSRSGYFLDRQYQASRIFEQAVQSSSSHIVFTDKNGVVQFANHGAERTTGYTAKEIIGNTPRLWGGLQDPLDYKELWEKKLAGDVFVGELVNHDKSHQKYNVLAHISPILDENKHVIGHIGTEENITKIKTSEVLALRNQERFEQMANTISSVFRIYAKEDGHMIFVSKACLSLWQYPAETFYKDPKTWMKRIHKDDQVRVRETFAKAIKDETSYSIDYRIVRDDGSVRDIRDTGGVVKGGSDTEELVVGEARDVTAEKEVDRVKTEFVSLASHQLRTPLTAINWFAEMLLDGDAGKLTKKQIEYVKEVHVGNKRMVELVNALLNTSRLDLGTFLIEPVATNLALMSKDVIKEMHSMIKTKKIDLHEDYQEGLPLINVDPKLMRIIFQNYISNAIKYTPEKGRVDVHVGVEADKMRIAVKDTGYGVPESQKEKIFDRLFRADNVRNKDTEGTGLGLYIVKSIMDQSGGKAWFESVENKGSTFYAEIPLSGMKKKEGSKSLE